MSSNNRKSRWGNSNASDQDAVAALLSSANQRRQENSSRDKNEQNNNKKRRYNDGDRNRNDEKSRDYKSDRGRDYKSDRGQDNSKKRPAPNDYYGPANGPNNVSEDLNDIDRTDEKAKTHKPDFGLSGALISGTNKEKGVTYKGVKLKFTEPPEARVPSKTAWQLHVFKNDNNEQVLHISKQSAYLIGKNEDICDIVLHHGSISSQHAVIQYRGMPINNSNKLSCQPYLMDLESTNGTYINNTQIEAARYYQLKKGDVLRFGASTREYVILSTPIRSEE